MFAEYAIACKEALHGFIVNITIRIRFTSKYREKEPFFFCILYFLLIERIHTWHISGHSK